MFGPLKSFICMKEREKENAVGHKSFWLLFGVNSHLFHYFIVSWWCCLCYDWWWQAAARSITAYIYCTLWFGCCFFPDSFFFLFFTSSEKLWILFSDTVLSTRVVNISPAQKKNQTICFVVSQIKNFLLFWLWFVEILCCSNWVCCNWFFSLFT